MQLPRQASASGGIGDLAAILPAARQPNPRSARLPECVTRPARGCAVRVERGTHADRQIQIARSVRRKTPGQGRGTALRAANCKRQVRLVGEPTHQGWDPQNPDREPRESPAEATGSLAPRPQPPGDPAGASGSRAGTRGTPWTAFPVRSAPPWKRRLTSPPGRGPWPSPEPMAELPRCAQRRPSEQAFPGRGSGGQQPTHVALGEASGPAHAGLGAPGVPPRTCRSSVVFGAPGSLDAHPRHRDGAASPPPARRLRRPQAGAAFRRQGGGPQRGGGLRRADRHGAPAP